MKPLVFIIISAFLFELYAKELSYNPSRLIIKIKDNKKFPKLKHLKSARNLFENVYVIETDNVKELEIESKNNKQIIYTQRDYIHKGKVTNNHHNSQYDNNLFNDPKISDSWFFKEKHGINFNKVHQEEISNPEHTIIVAVIDTGLDVNHQDLKNNIWINTDEIPNNNIDDDENGYVDDVYGINTLERDRLGIATSSIETSSSHGTAVSGIIGAEQNNNIGITGVASNVKIMGIKTVPHNADEKDVDVIEALIYAAENGARVINCSFSKVISEKQKAVYEAIDYVGNQYGVLVVNSAGNSKLNVDKNPRYPGSHMNFNLISVAATNQISELSFYSNYGKSTIHVAAPGDNIITTALRDKYLRAFGTSASAPIVSAIAAELLSNNPQLNVVELKDIIMKSSTRLESLNDKVKYGRVNLYNAIKRLNKN